MKKAVQILSAALLAICASLAYYFFCEGKRLDYYSDSSSVWFFLCRVEVIAVVAAAVLFVLLQTKNPNKVLLFVFCLAAAGVSVFMCVRYSLNLRDFINSGEEYFIFYNIAALVPSFIGTLAAAALAVLVLKKPKSDEEKEKSKEKKKQRLQDKIDKLN